MGLVSAAQTKERKVIMSWQACLLSCVIGVTVSLHMALLPVLAASSEARPSQPEASEPFAVACSPENLRVRYGHKARTHMRVWVTTSRQQPLHYTWTAVDGRVAGQGPTASWDLAGVKPGVYTATVQVSHSPRRAIDCSVQVLIWNPLRSGISRETGQAFLGPRQTETEGYGLYSYVLLGSPPDRHAKRRYLAMIDAYLQLFPAIASLEQYIPRRELNVTYLPLQEIPPTGKGTRVSPEWVLAHYDHARARAFLRGVPGTNRDGPYLVSVLKPLSQNVPLAGEYLFQDMTAVPPHLAATWMKAFLKQAAQERFWESRTTKRFVLKLRTIIGILGKDVLDIRQALTSWIAWR